MMLNNYSDLKASIGLFLAAALAGNIPKTNPTITAIKNESIMEFMDKTVSIPETISIT